MSSASHTLIRHRGYVKLHLRSSAFPFETGKKNVPLTVIKDSFFYPQTVFVKNDLLTPKGFGGQ